MIVSTLSLKPTGILPKESTRRDVKPGKNKLDKRDAVTKATLKLVPPTHANGLATSKVTSIKSPKRPPNSKLLTKTRETNLMIGLYLILVKIKIHIKDNKVKKDK